MTEKPILFSGSMVRAILDGRKTMTRRVIKQIGVAPGIGPVCRHGSDNSADWVKCCCPYPPGSHMWVRETWAEACDEYGSPIIVYRADNSAIYIGSSQDDGDHLIAPCNSQWSLDNYPAHGKWRPSIFMPRWASRITLEVLSVRAERLQEISVADVQKEGLFASLNQDPCDMADQLREKFKDLWDSINGKKYPWASNPFVWVIEFKRLDGQG